MSEDEDNNMQTQFIDNGKHLNPNPSYTFQINTKSILSSARQEAASEGYIK